MKILIDTCVIMDVLLNREPFYEYSQKIFLLAAQGFFKGYISTKSLTDIYYLVHKATHSDEKTRKIITDLLSLFDLADTNSVDCRKALISNIKDYEDAIIDEIADRMGFDYIVTRNDKDYKAAKTAVITPEQMVIALK